MKEANIGNFFNPKNIAIIGASNHIEKVGGILMKKAMASKCLVIPINPSHNQLLGLPCYSSVLDFKGTIDLAVIAIRSAFVSRAMEDCGKKGIKEVIVVSAGFSEVGNTSEEKKLLEIAKKYGIRLIGPNCFGIFHEKNNLDLTFAVTTPKVKNKDKGIVFVSQSGALWSYVSDYFDSKINLSSFVGLGNMSDLEFGDFIDYFSNSNEINSIVLYIEKIKDGKRFLDSSRRAIKLGKKIYAVKSGSTEKGAAAAFSHTASLASDYLIYSGVFKQAGIELCSTLEEAFSKASGIKSNVVVKKKLKKLGKTFIITNAGGAGALVSDILSEKGVIIVEKSLDIIGTALGDDYFKALQENSARADSFVIILTAQSMSDIENTAEKIALFKKTSGKNVVAVFLGDKVMSGANEIFEKNKIDYFNDFDSLKKAL